MKPVIDKKTIENLEKLIRIKIGQAKTEKLLGDLEKILEHFSELKELNTKNVLPMNGGTLSENVLRDDDARGDSFSSDLVVRQFPKTSAGFLKIPPVFDTEQTK